MSRGNGLNCGQLHFKIVLLGEGCVGMLMKFFVAS